LSDDERMKGNHRAVQDNTTNNVDCDGSGTGKIQKFGERHDDTNRKSSNEVVLNEGNSGSAWKIYARS
jgi:hypothetical protein